MVLYYTYIKADFIRYFPSALTRNMRSVLVNEVCACSFSTTFGPMTEPLVYRCKISSTGYNYNTTLNYHEILFHTMISGFGSQQL